MNINFYKIKEIYGTEVIKQIKNNIEDVLMNIDYLVKLDFTDIEDIFERCPLIFLYDKNIFQEKINFLIKKIGNNYIEEIENNLELLEEL